MSLHLSSPVSFRSISPKLALLLGALLWVSATACVPEGDGGTAGGDTTSTSGATDTTSTSGADGTSGSGDGTSGGDTSGTSGPRPR